MIMAKQAMTYEERLKKQRERAQKAVKKTGGDPREFVPGDGTTKIRILPAINFTQDTYNNQGELVGKKGEVDEFFYMTHAYHFFESQSEGSKGKLLWTPKHFEVNGKQVKDPADVAVAKMYDEARKIKDDKLKNLAGQIKRKRQYFMNILVYTKEDGEEKVEYKILKDSSNEGKLIRQICMHCGFPFYRDVQDEWVDEESLKVDEDRQLFDLTDVENGHDFKIIKERTGKENWDFTYEKSIVVAKPRPLTEEEEELLAERVDLRNFIEYCTYDEIKSALEDFLDGSVGDDDEEDEDEEFDAKAKAKAQIKNRRSSKIEEEDEESEDEEDTPKTKKTEKTSKKRRPVDEDDEDEDDEESDDDFDESLLDDLDDEDDEEEEEVKPKKKSKK
jgi:hypothetical protein